jgi:hypothetical protein
MSVAAAHVRMPHLRLGAGVRRAVPSLTLRSTQAGWALFDTLGHPVFEADGNSARLACLRKAHALGVVRVRAGEEPHV